MRYSNRRLFALASALSTAAALGACRSATAPRDRAVVTLAAAPTSVAAGDTVYLLGIAYNPTSDTVFAGYGCAPGIDFHAAAPGGAFSSLYAGLVFTCELKDSNVLAPGETDSVAFGWRTPAAVGVYRVRAGLGNSDGLRSPSAAQLITVR
jgi:hypothetical protein